MNVLVTGGAGFIGSNLARRLAALGTRVRVLDDLSTGHLSNLEGVDADVLSGDVRDPEAVRAAADGAEVVYHLAALPSVARSIADPRASHQVNATGTLNVLLAASAAGVRRVVYASSSSLYGDAPTLPKHEEMPVSPLSPYAASKLAGEAYARSAPRSLGVETVSLRFFNVFGPWQDPASEYAAVIPRFVTRMLDGMPPVIFGDGGHSRDFTYVDNAIDACLLAASAGGGAVGRTMNIGCGDRIRLLDLVATLNDHLGTSLRPEHEQPRPGDVRHSLADVALARRLIDYRPRVSLRDGLAQTVQWYQLRRPVIAGPTEKE